MRRFVSQLLVVVVLAVVAGCGDSTTPTTEKPKATEGVGRPRPGDDNKMEKIPKGAMKPVAD